MKRRRAAGLTLFELLVTLSIFGIIMSLTLFFYGQSMKINRRHDQGSEVYRRAHKCLTQIEQFLLSGTLLYASPNNLVVAPLRSEQAITDYRLLNFVPRAQVLSISEDGLFLQINEEKKKFYDLKTWEGISFAPQAFSDLEKQRRFDYVTLLYSAVPPSPTRQGRLYEFRRQVLLSRY